MTSERSPCPALPPGWQREVVIRKSGASSGKSDVYYHSPLGRRCRSKQEMLRHLDNDVDLAGFNYRSGHTDKVKQQQQRRAAAITKVIAKVPGRRQFSLLALKLKKAHGIWRPVYECRKTTKSDTDAAPANKKRLGDVVSEDDESLVTQMESETQKVHDTLQETEDMRQQMEGAFTAKDADFTVMDQQRGHNAKQISRLEELKSMDSQKDFMAVLNKSYSESVDYEKDFMAALNKSYPESVDCQKDFLAALNKLYTEQEHLHYDTLSQHPGKNLGEDETMSQHPGKKLGEDETMSQHLGKKLGEDAVKMIYLTRPEHLDGSKAMEATQDGVLRETRGGNSERYIKRPLNAFMLWATNERRKIPQKSPGVRRVTVTCHNMGSRWKSMTEQEKQPWFEEAERVRKILMEKYPDHTFKPKRHGGTAITDKKLHMVKPKQKKRSQRQEMGQSFSAGRGPSSSYHKARRKSKEVHVDSIHPQVGNASQHDAGRLIADHPNNPPQYMQVRAVTNEVSGSRIGGNNSEMHENSAAKVPALSLVRTMNWTIDELRMWIEHQSKALKQSEDVPATDVISELVSLYWGGSIAELKNELRRYNGQHFMDEVTEFCSKHLTSDTVILSHVLCSWGKMKEDYQVLDHDYVHTEVPYTSSWWNINEQLDDIDKEFGFPQSLRCAHERDKQSKPESDYETAEKEDVFIQNGCSVETSTDSVETSTDSSDSFPSLKIHVLPPDKQGCSYQAKSEKSAVQPEKLFSVSVVNELCEMANNSEADSDTLEDKIKSAMEEYCRETMADGCTDVREIMNLKNYKEMRHFSNAEPKSISLPNTSSVDHSYRSSIARLEEGQTPTGFRLRDESSDKQLSPGDTPDKAGFELVVDTTVKLALFGSDNGKRVVNGKGITRANCSKVFFPPQVLTVIDTPVKYQTFRDLAQSSPAFDSKPKRGRPRKNVYPKFVKPGSWWGYKRPLHVFPYNP